MEWLKKLFRKSRKRKKRPTRMYAAIRLAQMFAKDGMGYGMALAVAIHQITPNYDNWSKDDNEWFWQHLEADEQALENGDLK